MRAGRWKLVDGPGDRPDELYDLVADPGERRDLLATRASEAGRLREILAGWKRRHGREFGVPEFSPQLRRMLEALGYAE